MLFVKFFFSNEFVVPIINKLLYVSYTAAFVPVVAPQPAPSAAIVYKQYAQQAPAYTPGPVYAILRQSQDVGLDGYYYE